MRFLQHLIIILPLLILNSCFVVYNFDDEPNTNNSNNSCGNGIIDPDEDCEGDYLNADCNNIGFAGGNLYCDSNCHFDTSQCWNVECGNNVREEEEVCDTNDLNGATCETEGFSEGTLACDSKCKFDLSNCFYDCNPDTIYADTPTVCADLTSVCRLDPTDYEAAVCSDGPGPNSYYGTCSSSNECPVGSGCYAIAGGDIGMCLAYCDPTVNHFESEGGECPYYLDGATSGSCTMLTSPGGINLNLCTVSCQSDGDCFGGEACYPFNAADLDTKFCLPAGTVDLNGQCDYVNECQPGYYCVDGACQSM